MSIYDRDYMKHRVGGNKLFSFLGGSPSKILILANVVAFFLQAIFENAFGVAEFRAMFALSWEGVLSGKIWTFVTYAFMHASILHIFCNMLGLYFIGQYVEKVFGARKFYFMYFTGAIVGGIAWLLLSLFSSIPEVLVGASAAVMAIFAVFCVSYPPMPITFLLFFVIPISMRPMTMLKITAVLETLGLLSSFLGGENVVAYSAHLGGMVSGLVCAGWAVRGRLAFLDSFNMSIFLKKNKSRGGNASDYAFKVNISDSPKNVDEVDRILDKISEKGFASLTEAERQTLREARDSYSFKK